MLVIGMLHHRKHPNKVKKAYAYAAVAQAEGAGLIYFSPKGVDFTKGKITGYKYIDGAWQKVVSPFPDVIYNAGSPVKLNRSTEIIERLKRIIPFTTHSIGNKLSVYKRLKEDGTFASYLIPTHTIINLNEFKKYLKLYPKMIIKPVDGHKGQNITYIENHGENYHVSNKEMDEDYTIDVLSDYIKELMTKHDYIIQPYIKCRTKSGHVYDFRLHTQKDGEGNWIITAIYPRIGASGSIVANINSGGSTNYLEPFLKQEFGDQYYDIMQYLKQFSLKLSKKMDQLQELYFNERIDELGIDVGLDEDHKIWIFEVNWRPGCPPAFYLELDVVKNFIRYALYLAKGGKA